MSNERWVRSFLLVEILSTVEFWFLTYIVSANWSEVSHNASEYLAWSPLDLLSLFVVEGLHGEQNKRIKGG